VTSVSQTFFDHFKLIKVLFKNVKYYNFQYIKHTNFYKSLPLENFKECYGDTR